MCEISGVVFGWSSCVRVRTMKRVVLPTLTICVYDMCVRYAIPTEESMCGRPTNTNLVLNRVVRCLGYVRNVGRLGCLHLCLVVGWFVAAWQNAERTDTGLVAIDARRKCFPIHLQAMMSCSVVLLPLEHILKSCP